MSFRPLYARQPLSLLLTQTASLNLLVDKALHLNQLQVYLNKYVQPAIQENCHVASFERGILTIMATQAHWATRLRYQQNRLIQQLLNHKEFAGLSKILIKVSPATNTNPQAERYLEMPSSAAKTIEDTAQHIKHPALKASLERLARHAKTKS